MSCVCAVQGSVRYVPIETQVLGCPLSLAPFPGFLLVWLPFPLAGCARAAVSGPPVPLWHVWGLVTWCGRLGVRFDGVARGLNRGAHGLQRLGWAAVQGVGGAG